MNIRVLFTSRCQQQTGERRVKHTLLGGSNIIYIRFAFRQLAKSQYERCLRDVTDNYLALCLRYRDVMKVHNVTLYWRSTKRAGKIISFNT